MFIVEINDFSAPIMITSALTLELMTAMLETGCQYFPQNESAMSLYPKMFLRVAIPYMYNKFHACIINSTFFHLSAVLLYRGAEIGYCSDMTRTMHWGIHFSCHCISYKAERGYIL